MIPKFRIAVLIEGKSDSQSQAAFTLAAQRSLASFLRLRS